MFQKIIKRLMDFSLSLLGLLVLSPLLLFLALLIAWKLGWPVFFTQVRPGKHGKSFRMIKFRSMTNTRSSQGNMLPNEQRMTKFGSILRSTSLDELPGLTNVLKGDVSLVGPRPLLVDYLPLYNNLQNRRMEVKPGITGWSQINGRNSLTWDEKFELDVWYVDNRSFWLDMKILFITIKKVFQRDGITHEGDVAMPRFTGNK